MLIKSNRKVFFDYEIVKEFEAGIMLEGWEVKSIKAGNINFQGSYILVRGEEVWLRNAEVGNWPAAPKHTDIERNREKKLLLNKIEIRKMASLVATNRRLTTVPLELFLHKNLIKIKIAVVQSRRKYEKRAKIKERDLTRSINQELKNAKQW